MKYPCLNYSKLKFLYLQKKKNLQAKIPEMCFSLRSFVAFFYKNSQNSHCYMQSFFFFFLHTKAPIRISSFQALKVCLSEDSMSSPSRDISYRLLEVLFALQKMSILFCNSFVKLFIGIKLYKK